MSAVQLSKVDLLVQEGGRVMALLTSGATAIAPLGLLIAGPFSDWMGIRVWFWAGGILCVFIALSAFFRPVIMNVEAHNEVTQTQVSEPI